MGCREGSTGTDGIGIEVGPVGMTEGQETMIVGPLIIDVETDWDDVCLASLPAM